MDMEQFSFFPDEKVEEYTEENIIITEHKRKKKRTHDDWMSGLEIEEIIHEVSDKICDHCGSEMKRIGVDKAYDELVYTPAKFHIRRHFAEAVKCPVCGENPENDSKYSKDIETCNIRRAEYPRTIIPGSFCSPELMAHIVYEKYAKAVPLNRQEKDFNSKNIPAAEGNYV